MAGMASATAMISDVSGELEVGICKSKELAFTSRK